MFSVNKLLNAEENRVSCALIFSKNSTYRTIDSRCCRFSLYSLTNRKLEKEN